MRPCWTWGLSEKGEIAKLVDRCNRLMVLLFLEEVRVRHLVEQNRQANGVIETAAETLQKMTEVLCRTVGALDGAGQRPA